VSIAAGTKLGPYEILDAIGAGGMGEVYRAQDTRLDRTVAIKVLADHLTARPEVRQRFDREARAVSSLNHPHICTLYDVGHENGVDYIVMEYLEGETIDKRLASGPLPLQDLLKYAAQIADGLDKAHRQGLIHRDLKPANIMITSTGAKLLDFGLARSIAMNPSSDLSQSPTMGHSLTAEGSIVGTFQYMAPEQLEGRESDARTDIFSFGATLYEMATGRKAFPGDTQASLIASIMSKEPVAISTVQGTSPPALDRLVRKCLAKDPDDRWQSARDVTSELEWIAEGGSQVGVPAKVSARRKTRERLAWLLAAVFAVVAVVLAVVNLSRTDPVVHKMQFQIATPKDVVSMGSPRISPDGQYIVFAATDSAGTFQLWLRPLDALEASPLQGTEDLTGRPFWSPDSKWVGFFASGKLKKASVTGGPPQTICDCQGADASWGSSGLILFDVSAGDSIYQVPSAGGEAKVATSFDRSLGDNTHGWPQFLPDGQHFLYVAYTSSTSPISMRIGEIGSLDYRPLPGGDSRMEYVPPGYLFFVRDGTLMAHPFDAEAIDFAGDPFPVADEVGSTTFGLAHFSSSQNGVMIYRTGASSIDELVWTDRSGIEIARIGERADYQHPALSPDEKRVAVEVDDGGLGDIWVLDMTRDIRSRFTFHGGDDWDPIWSPDGEMIAFMSDREGRAGLFLKRATGEGEADSLFLTGAFSGTTDWSRDGRYIAYSAFEAPNGMNIHVADVSRENPAIAFETRAAHQVQARFSPDSRFIAYSSNESGRWEVYVRSFPTGAGKWQVSNRGGTEPMWRGDGKELFYIAPDRRLMSVEVNTSASFEAKIPKPLFEAPLDNDPNARNRYVVSDDGQRFLFVVPLVSGARAPTNVIVNWDAELEIQ
jgi:serine/threonine protein kinase